MEFLEYFLPDASTLNLKHWDLDAESHQMVVTVCSTQSVACCPLCQSLTERVHSRYERTLQDLPLAQFGLIIVLEVCKFFCNYSGLIKPECFQGRSKGPLSSTC